MGPAAEAGPGPDAGSGAGSGSGSGSGSVSGSGEEWFGLLPRTRLQPDTRHRFRLAGSPAVAAARLDVYPDGGMARLRLWGEADPAAHQAAAARWLDALPPAQAATVLAEAGLPAARATAIAAAAAGRWDMLPAPARAALTR
jgi:allantoicase